MEKQHAKVILSLEFFGIIVYVLTFWAIENTTGGIGFGDSPSWHFIIVMFGVMFLPLIWLALLVLIIFSIPSLIKNSNISNNQTKISNKASIAILVTGFSWLVICVLL